MRVSKTFVSIFMVVVLLAVTAGPALAAPNAAEKIQVNFSNKTGEQVTLSLSGPGSYSFHLATGKNKVEVNPGKYNYSYKACGTTITGKFNAKKNGDTLNLPKCSTGGGGGGGGETKVTIKNQTGGALTIYLSGPKSYSFTFGSGTSKMTVTPGKYSYTVYAACGSDSGTKNLKGGGLVWTWWCY